MQRVMVWLAWMALVMTPACAPADPAGDDDDDDVPAPDAAAGQPDASEQPDPPDASLPDPTGQPGSACSCDGDCAADGNHPGVCVYGICMTMASGQCSAAGSTEECGAGSRCWGLEGVDGYLCWPDCASYDCDGTCDGDGSCAPTASTNCDPSCGSYCSCESDDQCGEGESCIGNSCVPTPQTGDGPGPGPGPTCTDLPPRDCNGTASYCGQLVVFNPRTTAYYDDYPINGETATNQYRSYLRRDLKMLLEHVTAKVLCKTAAWDTGNGGALGLGDMSEANGAIPGTSIGDPGHPEGTHTNGFDIDLGYYQKGTANNRLRPICTHTTNGVDQYHCTGEPTLLDTWRHALFLGYVFESPRTRVVGVDGKAGPSLDAAIAELCDLGWLSASGPACNNPALAYETTDQGYGWYYFHHHHSHVSLKPWGTATADTGTMPCYAGSCQGIAKPAPHQIRQR